jgi:hypothetical protein
MSLNTRILSGALLGVLVLFSFASAGDRSNVRGVSMARTYIVLSRSIDCMGINPANLGLDDRLPFTLALPSVGARVSSSMLSLDQYNNYFTGVPDPLNPSQKIGKVLTTQDKNDLLSSMPDNGATRADLEANLIGMSIQLGRIGSIGFDVTEHVGAKLDLPKQYVKLFLFGFDSLGSNYNFNGTAASAWWYREWNVSYANHLPWDLPLMHDVRFGVGFKILRGYGVMVTDHYNASIANTNVGTPSFPQYQMNAAFDFLTRRSGSDVFSTDTSTNKSKFNFKPFPDPAGKGVGLDFGINGEVMDGFRLGISVTDIGKITWDQNLVETYGAYSLSVTDPFNLPAQDSLKNGFKGYNRPGQSFVTALPTRFRIGASFETKKMPVLHYLPGNFLMEVDYNQGLNNSLGNSTIPRFSLGTEWRIIPILPLRTGITVGGGDQFRWAFGFGLDVWVLSLDVGTENFGMLFTPKSTAMLSVGAGLRIRL